MTRALSILHTEASLGWGGQEIRILGEAAGMAARGHSVTLAAPEESNIYREARERGVNAVALPVGRKKIRGVAALRNFLKAHPVDVLNAHSSTDSWLAALACVTLSNPPALVRTRHISAPVPNNFTTRWLYRSATRFIATTGEALREQMIAEVGVAADRVASVPTGIDLTRFGPADAAARAALRNTLGLPANVPVVGIVATLRSWKGHRYLIDAMLNIPAAHLAIVGDGPQRQALEEQVSAHGMVDRVTFSGNQKNVVPWLQSFDVFALPSYANEGVPQAIMQAMACGLPVVTTPIGSIAEIVAGGVTGVMVEPQDAASLKLAIEDLLADHALRARLAEASRACAVERFSDTLMVDRMERIFLSVAAPHG